MSTGVDRVSNSATMAFTPLSMPLFNAMGSTPAATSLIPSRTIKWAKMVAVVVPSPADSLVLVAASLIS